MAGRGCAAWRGSRRALRAAARRFSSRPPPALVLYHNPRCSKSASALQLLERSEEAFEVRRYVDVPPSANEVRALVRAVENGPVPQPASALDRDARQGATEDEVVEAVAADPKRLQRPVLLDRGRHAAVIGRPPSNLVLLLGRAPP